MMVIFLLAFAEGKRKTGVANAWGARQKDQTGPMWTDCSLQGLFQADLESLLLLRQYDPV